VLHWNDECRRMPTSTLCGRQARQLPRFCQPKERIPAMKLPIAFLVFASTVFSPVLSFVQDEEDTLLQLQVMQGHESTAISPTVPAPTPWCNKGNKNIKGDHCCPKWCDTCGGKGCFGRNSGPKEAKSSKCCIHRIKGKLCLDEDSTACKLPAEAIRQATRLALQSDGTCATDCNGPDCFSGEWEEVGNLHKRGCIQANVIHGSDKRWIVSPNADASGVNVHCPGYADWTNQGDNQVGANCFQTWGKQYCINAAKNVLYGPAGIVWSKRTPTCGSHVEIECAAPKWVNTSTCGTL